MFAYSSDSGSHRALGEISCNRGFLVVHIVKKICDENFLLPFRKRLIDVCNHFDAFLTYKTCVNSFNRKSHIYTFCLMEKRYGVVMTKLVSILALYLVLSNTNNPANWVLVILVLIIFLNRLKKSILYTITAFFMFPEGLYR